MALLRGSALILLLGNECVSAQSMCRSESWGPGGADQMVRMTCHGISLEACCAMKGYYVEDQGEESNDTDSDGGEMGSICIIDGESGMVDWPGSLPARFYGTTEACEEAGGTVSDVLTCADAQDALDESYCSYEWAACCDGRGMACDCKDESALLSQVSQAQQMCLDFDFPRHGANACSESMRTTLESLDCREMDEGNCEDVVAALAGTDMEDMKMKDLCSMKCKVCPESDWPPVEGLCANIEDELGEHVAIVNCLDITKDKCCEIGGRVTEMNMDGGSDGDVCFPFEPDWGCSIEATSGDDDVDKICRDAGGTPHQPQTCKAMLDDLMVSMGPSCNDQMQGTMAYLQMMGCCGAGPAACGGQGVMSPVCATESDFMPDSTIEVKCLNLDPEACCEAGGSVEYPALDENDDMNGYSANYDDYCIANSGGGDDMAPKCTFRKMGGITDPVAACTEAGGTPADGWDSLTCAMLQMSLTQNPDSRWEICSGGQAALELLSATCCGGEALHDELCPESDGDMMQETLCMGDDTLLADRTVVVTCELTAAKCCELGHPTAGLSHMMQEGCAMIGATEESMPCDLLATFHPGEDLEEVCTDNGGKVSDTLTCQFLEDNVLANTEVAAGDCQDWPTWAPALADRCCSSGVSFCRQLPPDEELDMGRALCEDDDISREDIGAPIMLACSGLTEEKCCEVGGFGPDPIAEDEWMALGMELRMDPMEVCNADGSDEFVSMGPKICLLFGKDAEEVCTSNSGAAVARETCFDRASELFKHLDRMGSLSEESSIDMVSQSFMEMNEYLKSVQMGCCPGGKPAKELPSWFPELPGKVNVAEELCMDQEAFQDAPMEFTCMFADLDKCCLAGGESEEGEMEVCAGAGTCKFSGKQVLPAREMCQDVGGFLMHTVSCSEAWAWYKEQVGTFWEGMELDVEDVCDMDLEGETLRDHLRWFDSCCMGGDEDVVKGAKCDPMKREGMGEAAESFCGGEEEAFMPNAHPAVTCVGLTKEVCCSKGWDWMDLASEDSIDEGAYAAPECKSTSANGDAACLATGPDPAVACKIAGGYPKMPEWSRCLETVTGYAEFIKEFDGDLTCDTIVDETGMSAEQMLGYMTFESHACCRNGKTLCQMPAERTSPVNYCMNPDNMNHNLPLIVECKLLADDKCTEVGGTVDTDAGDPSICEADAGASGPCRLDASDGSVTGSANAVCSNEGGIPKTLYTCADFWESPKFATFGVDVADIEAAAGDEDALCAIDGITDLFNYAAALGCCTDRLPMCGPKTSPARDPVVVSDKITGLDFDAVESDPVLKEYLETTFQNTYAEEFGVPKDAVNIDLSAGSVIVTATIQTTEATEAFVLAKAEEVAAQAAAGGSSSLAAALIAVVTSAPGIENAIQPGMTIGVELNEPTPTTTTLLDEEDDDLVQSEIPATPEGSSAFPRAGALSAAAAALLAVAMLGA